MSIVKHNGNFPSLIEEMVGRDMQELFNWPGFTWTGTRLGGNVPAVNMKDEDDSYVLEVAAPGMKKEDFKVILHNGILSVSTEKQTEAQKEEKRYTKREFNYHSFSRSFQLPDSCDHEKIEARYQDGILHLTVPKKEEAKRKEPKQIPIS